MSIPAVVFMVLTMGGVIGLNVLCLATWIRGAKSEPSDEGEPVAGEQAKPPESRAG